MNIGRRFALWIVSILLVVGTAAVSLFYLVELRGEADKLDMFGRLSGRVIEESLITYMQRRDQAGLSEKLESVKQSSGNISRILLLNKDGVVKAATDKGLLEKKFSARDAGCRECHEKRWPGLLLGGGDTYRWAAPVMNKTACQSCHLASAKNNGVLVIDFSVAEFQNHVRKEIAAGLFIFISALAVIGFIMIYLSRVLVTRRLARVGAAMKDFQAGDITVRTTGEGSDEIAQLETGFNELAQTIAVREQEKNGLLARLNAANEELQHEIAGRNRWELALKEQKVFAENMIQNSAVATFVVNPRHEVVFWNSACEELTGIRAADMIGTSDQWKPFYPQKRQTLSDVVIDGNTGDLSSLYEKPARSTLAPNGLQSEGWYKNLNNRERYIIFDAAPIYDSTGALTAVIETLQDITAKKRMEEELAKNENLLRTIIDTEPECVKVVSRDGELLEMNPAGLAMLEADTFDQLSCRSLSSLVAPEHRHAFEKLSLDVFQGASGMLEFEVVGLKGARRWLETHAAPLRNPQGEIFALLGVTRDITERKRWERALQDQLQFLQRLIDTIPMPVFYKDINGVYLGYNKAFEKFIGLPKNQLIGKTVYDVAPRELADRYHREDRELFDHPGIQIYDYSVKHADGTIHDVIFSKATFTDSQGNTAGLIGAMQDITDRKRMERALRQTNETLQAVIKASPLAVVSFDANGNVGMWNAAAERIFGWSEEEAIGRFNPLVNRENKQEFQDLLGRVLGGDSLMGIELKRNKKDGTEIDVSVSSAALRSVNNEIVGILSVISDITERKKAAEVIKRNYDTQTAINWVLHISLENISLDSILKQTLDLILSIPWLAFESRGSVFLVEGGPDKLVMRAQRGLSDAHREACRIVPFGTCLCGRAAARGEVQFAESLDERHEIRYDGIVPHGHYCVPIMHAKTVLGVINLYLKEGHEQDHREIEFLSAVASALAGIIQRKRAEEEREKLIADLRNVLDAVSRSQREWQDTFDSITDMITILDRDFTIMKANKAFSAYYGLSLSGMINKKCYEIIHDADSPITSCPHRVTLNEKIPAGGEFFDKRTNKTFQVFTFPYRSPEGESLGTIHVMRDITDEKEKELRLIMSERLAALGQMASGIAHEINNPLASVAGCSEGLLARVRKGQYDPPLFESYLNIIQEEVFRCKSITTAMLSFVKKTSYEKKEISLPEALDKALEIIGFQGRLKHIEILKQYDASTPVIHGNEGELRQVLLIVVTNALDAMEDNGTLTLDTCGREGSAVIRIIDTGGGISPEIIANIFDPFFTTKSERGGTGLGLSIARKIVANHNGQIEASSSAGKGTTVTITLPQ